MTHNPNVGLSLRHAKIRCVGAVPKSLITVRHVLLHVVAGRR